MARRGDLIVVNPQRVGGASREGEIIEVIEGNLRVRYRIRWKDGHETLFAPAAGAARIEHVRNRKKAASQAVKRSPAKATTAKKSLGKKRSTKKSSRKG